MWIRSTVGAAGALLALIGSARAQAPYPSAPITIVLPFSAGGSADAAMRLYADLFGRNTGGHVVIENRAGGGGAVAAMTVKKAQPDGYTLRLADIGADAILPLLQKLAYDPIKDFSPITVLLSWPQFLVVPANSPAHSVADVVALARSKPGGLTHGSQGVGSGGHLLGAMLQMATGAKLVHVPYKGGGPLSIDLIGGRIDLAFISYREAKPALADGKIRVIAVAAPHRASVLPDIPTMAEAGYPSVELSPWFGLVAPAGTPEPIIRKLHDEFAKVAADPELRKRLGEDAIDATINTPAEFRSMIVSETQRLGKVVNALGIHVE
jgi:tripartite-type tricarboxylate transporter receptor subunit TctC